MRKIEEIIIDEFANYFIIQRDKKYAKLYEEMLECESKVIALIGKENLPILNKYEIASDMIICRTEELLVSFVLDFMRQFFNKKRKW